MSEVTPVLTDASTLRAKIHEKTQAALRSVFPLDLKGRTLELEDVKVHAQDYSPSQQRRALLTGSSLYEPVKGTLILRDGAGKVVDTAKNFTLAHVPYLTERHTLISDGNEYQMANQLRRKPGVYTQRSDNGELKNVFNLGRGSNFDLGMNEGKGTFHMTYGTTNLPLYAVLRGLGASHEQIAGKWGAGVAKANEVAHGHQIESTIAKLYGKLEHPALIKPGATHEEKLQAVQKRYGLSTLDPEVTKQTLGHGHASVTPHALLDASAKMLRVHKGEEVVDDTDSLAFKTFHSMDDFLAERIRLTARAWAPKARMALNGKTEIREALRPGPFSAAIRKFVTTSNLAAVPTGINPMELIDHAVKVTSLGEGGIPSDRAIPLDARMIHNTHFGALDPVRTPESNHSGVDIRASIAAHRDDAGNLYTVLRNIKSGKMELIRAGDQRKHVVAFPHQQLKGEVDAFIDGKLEKVDASKVTHQLDHIKHAYSPATSMVPFLHSMQGNRAIMASKFGTQALPLLEREVPLLQVRSHLEGGESFEQVYGHMVNPTAPVAGTVRKVDGDYVWIEPHKKGKTAEAKRTAVIVTGNPKYITNNPDAAKFYDALESHLQGRGYAVSRDPGEPHTSPPVADLWVGHSRGADRLRFAPEGTATIAVGSNREGAINHGRDDVSRAPGTKTPPKSHYVLTHAMRDALDGVKTAEWEGELDEVLTEIEKTAAPSAGLVKVPYQTQFPFPSKTSLHHDVIVKPGDKVEAGQQLGESNYTRKGTLALGKNLLVGYVAYNGVNSNDAMVISEGASKKLTSEHMYREIYPVNARIELNTAKHKLYYGSKYQPQQYANLDADGVIKKGSKVNPKDILIAGLTKQQVSGSDALVGRISKALTKPYKEVVLEWTHGGPGVVEDVVRTPTQITVLISTQERMQIGDKIAARHANKGVVSRIVPDHEMIRDEQGRPLDVLITSAGVISRVNPSQILETCAAKVAEKIGKPIIFDNAAGVNAVKWVRGLMKEHGVKDKEVVFDPITKRHIAGPDGKGVLVGRQYIYKLFKSTDTNFAGHGVGPYDLNEQPLKTGGDDSAKGLGKMEFDALLAHNARNFLNEASTVRGTKNEEFWKAVQLGLPMPTPKPSFAFNKFVGMLEGAGVRIDKRGSKFHILPLTDKDVTKRSAGAIENNKTLQAKDSKPEKGGLFDPSKTGGPSGTLYAHIDLHEPIPSPVFKEPVRRLLGMTEKQFDTALGEHGGGWFKSELNKIQPDKKLQELRSRMARANGPVLNDLVKQVKYLEALKTHGMSPSEAYIISKVPVIPPVFRPILPGVSDPTQLMVADANKLYAQLMDANHTLKNTALPSDLGKHRNEVFSTVEELYGTTLPRDPKMQQQKVKGFLSTIAGVGTPKGGFFQRKLMRKNMDVSGRGTIVPDVNLGMDEIGIPEKMLWGMLDKLVVARLIRKGYPALDARELVKQQAPAAREAMLEETRERPVLLNRAPTLHRWSIVAAYAKPVQGKTVRINPFVEKGLNADFDGNCFVGSTEVYLTLDGPASTFVGGDTPMKFGSNTIVVCRTSEGTLVKTTLDNIPYLPETKRVDRNGASVYDVPQGMKVWSYTHEGGATVMAPVDAITVEENCAVAEVETQRGFKVTASTNDSLCVYDHESEDIVSCKPEDALERLLPVMRQLPCEGTTHDFEFGWMLGAFISDGFLQKPDGFGYTKVSDLHRERFAAAVDRYEGKTVKRTTFRAEHSGADTVHGASIKDRVYHAPKAYALFQQCFVEERLEGRACLSKQLPDLSAWSFDALVGLLAGLLDGDGSLSVSRGKAKPQVLVNFSTSAPGLVAGLEMLCNLLSIRRSVTAYDPKEGRLQTHRAYCVNLSIIDIRRYAPRLFTETSLINAAAREAVELLQGELTDKLDLVPVPHRIMRDCSRRNGPCQADAALTASLATTKSSRKKAPYVSRATAERMLKFLRGAEYPDLERWAHLVEAKDVLWDVIKTSTPLGAATVYDLMVPSTKVFAVNGGMVVWDTVQIHAPITPGSIADAKQMTLSNMLLSDQQRNKLLAFPQHEAIIGITLAAKGGTGTGAARKFATRDDAIAAWRRGELQLNDAIEVKPAKHAEEEEESDVGPDVDVSFFPAEYVTGVGLE